LKAGLISPEDAVKIWDRVGPMLQKVVDHTEGELQPEDFLDNIVNKYMHLWLAVEDADILMAMVTQIIEYPRRKTLRIIALSGKNFKETHSQFNDMIESFAIQAGCSGLELWGRKGWKKMLPDWESNYIVFTKNLKERMQ
jgi:hypothetical protein